MLTLKFEHDTRSSDSGDVTFMIEVPSFRTREQRDGAIDVLIENEHGVQISHPVNGTVGGYDRCYVMNHAGQTVAKLVPQPPGCCKPITDWGAESGLSAA